MTVLLTLTFWLQRADCFGPFVQCEYTEKTSLLNDRQAAVFLLSLQESLQ